MDQQTIYRRIVRRETHSPRSGAAVLFASVLALALLAAVAIGAWWMLDAGFRAGAERWTLPEGSDIDTVMIIGGIAALVLAVLLIAAAVAPGPRARRARVTDRMALLVDDGVLADAAAHAVAHRCGLPPAQVSATVGRREVVIRLTPISGVRVDRALAGRAAADAIAEAEFDTTPRVEISERGVIA